MDGSGWLVSLLSWCTDLKNWELGMGYFLQFGLILKANKSRVHILGGYFVWDFWGRGQCGGNWGKEPKMEGWNGDGDVVGETVTGRERKRIGEWGG